MGTQLPLSKRGGTPKFSVHVYWGQTAGWIKMALGMEVGLRPGHTVLDGTQVFPQKGDRAHDFRSISIVAKVPNGWMHQDAT